MSTVAFEGKSTSISADNVIDSDTRMCVTASEKDALARVPSTTYSSLLWVAAVGTSSLVATDMAASGVVDFAPSTRGECDLRGVTTVRFNIYVTAAGSTNSRVGMQYSLDQGSTWTWIDGTLGTTDTGAAITAQTITLVGTGFKASANITLHAAAKTATTWVRLVGVAGDGTTDPGIRNVAFKAVTV